MFFLFFFPAAVKKEKKKVAMDKNVEESEEERQSSDEDELEIGLDRRKNLEDLDKVLKTEEPLDPITKIDTRKRKAITAENLFPDLKDTAFGKTVDIMGMMYRGPGRLLIAEDEFFKTLAYRSELHALAYRHGMEVFKKTGNSLKCFD